jgi:hypothetical protein
MPQRSSEEREFIRDWIRLYKSLPALWNTKSHEYNNRKEKNLGYQILVDKFRERNLEANREDVTKKINSLRTNYRKEMKRINDLKQSGYEKAESNLWYYEEMSFLDQVQEPSQNQTHDLDQNSCNVKEENLDEYSNYEVEINDHYRSPKIYRFLFLDSTGRKRLQL